MYYLTLQGTKKEKKTGPSGTGGSFILQPPPGSKGGLLAPPPADLRAASAQKAPSHMFPSTVPAVTGQGPGHSDSVFGFVGAQQSGSCTTSSNATTVSHAFDDPFGFSSTNSTAIPSTASRPTGSGEVNLLDL